MTALIAAIPVFFLFGLGVGIWDTERLTHQAYRQGWQDGTNDRKRMW